MKYVVNSFYGIEGRDPVEGIYTDRAKAERVALECFHDLCKYQNIDPTKVSVWIGCYDDDDPDLTIDPPSEIDLKVLYTIIDEGDREGLFEFRSFDHREAQETFRSVCKQHRDEDIDAPVILYTWVIITKCTDADVAYEEWYDEHGETLEESPDATMISCEEYL